MAPTLLIIAMELILIHRLRPPIMSIIRGISIMTKQTRRIVVLHLIMTGPPHMVVGTPPIGIMMNRIEEEEEET